MSADKTSPNQASDEITDAALDKVSGGVDRSGGGGRGSGPSAEDFNKTRQPQRMPMPPTNGSMNQTPRR